MNYVLNQTEIALINSSIPIIKDSYHENTSLEIIKLLERGCQNGYLEDDELYRLLSLLPQIIPEQREQAVSRKETELEEWFDKDEAEYQKRKRRMEELSRILSHKLFMQQAVYDKQIWNKQKQEKMNGQTLF